MQNAPKPSHEITTWEPEQGWLFLLPSRLPETHGKILLPESYTKKSTSGICFKDTLGAYQDRECFFPAHSEYQVKDTDTGYTFYVIEANKVVMTRTPPDDVNRISREKPKDGLTFETIESQPAAA